jgi:hypothetical protein
MLPQIELFFDRRDRRITSGARFIAPPVIEADLEGTREIVEGIKLLVEPREI